MRNKMLSLILAVTLFPWCFNHAEGRTLKGEDITTKSLSAASKVQPMVAAGYFFSAVLRENGTVWCCGLNENGELGVGKTYFSSKAAVQVKGLSDVIAIESTRSYTLALKKDGTVWGWGDEGYHLGIGKPENCLYASKIAGLEDIAGICAGQSITAFLKRDGTVWYMKAEEYSPATKPIRLKELTDITAIDCMDREFIALKKDGSVWTWEVVYETDKLTTPIKEKLTGVKSVAAGGFHYLAIKKDNTVWAKGWNKHGQLGVSGIENASEFLQVKNLKDVVTIGAGYLNSFAVSKDGSFYAWGNNEFGQLGNNSLKNSDKPVKISRLAGTISVDGDLRHTVALKSNGEVMAMGNLIHGGEKVVQYKFPTLLMELNKLDKSSTVKEIIPDGSLADWDGIEPIAYGQKFGEGKKTSGIEALYACRDSKYLYMAAEITEGIPLAAVFGLEYDMKGDSDYGIHFAIDRTALVFRFNSKGRVADGYGVYGDVIEIRVPLSDLGNPKELHINCIYSYEKNKAVNTEVHSWYPVPELIKAKDGSLKIDPAELLTGKIKLDGSMEDWSTMHYNEVSDQVGDVGKNSADITAVDTAIDQEYLYVAVKTKGGIPSVGIELDTDGDGAEEYGVNSSYSYLSMGIEQYTSGKNKLIADGLKYIAYNEVFELVVPLKLIGNPKEVTINALWTNVEDSSAKSDQINQPIHVVNQS